MYMHGKAKPSKPLPKHSKQKMKVCNLAENAYRFGNYNSSIRNVLDTLHLILHWIRNDLWNKKKVVRNGKTLKLPVLQVELKVIYGSSHFW